MEELLGQELFRIGSLSISLGQLVQIIVIVGLLLLLAYLLLVRWLPRFYDREDTATELRPRARRVILWAVVMVSLITILRTLGLDFDLLKLDLGEDHTRVAYGISIRISTLVKALLAISIARLLDWAIEEFLTQRYYRQTQTEGKTTRLSGIAERFAAARPVVYTLVAIFIANDIDIYDYTLFGNSRTESGIVTIGSILSGLLVFFIARFLLLAGTNFALSRYYQRAEVDQGSQYALNRLLTYLAYFIGVILMLQTAGFNLVALWTGAAALLVGIGIGLQQTFNDLICGIIILFEQTVKVGDIVDMGGQDRVGTVRKIGTRTSQVETRDGILVYVPNSKLIGESVVNWSQTERKVRFHISVGVAYGSDTDRVKTILLEVAEKHQRIMKLPKP
ncbi:MAG: mechanosensitive ion channel domain-containing protein, partial [Bacteroidota bacterium]